MLLLGSNVKIWLETSFFPVQRPCDYYITERITVTYEIPSQVCPVARITLSCCDSVRSAANAVSCRLRLLGFEILPH